MIEPLRYAKESAPPHIIDQAVFCGVCLADRKTRKNPKIASKYCHDCFKNNYMCLSCDAKEHGLMKTKHHTRSLLVVGPPVRKKVLTRGDAVNFPMFLDDVKIKFKARVFDNGKMVHRTPVRYFEFKSGQSGDSIHVQVLGCRNLLASDAHGSSDPFISAVYCGVPLGMTRTRHRTVNPKWTNETYVIPCSPDLPPPREESFSQKNLLRLEVFDRDYLTSNDFLGHVELSRKKLLDMANYSQGKPLNLNLTARHHHGTISVRMGTNGDILYLKVVGGESLEKTDGFGLSDPFCKVYFKGRHVGTTPVCKNTVTPKWKRKNSFAVSLVDVLDEEERIIEILKQEELEARRGLRRGAMKPLMQSTGGSSRDVRSASNKQDNEDESRRNQQIDELNNKSLFFLELYDYNNFNPSQLLGHIRVPVEALRKLVPILPSETEPIPRGQSMNHMLFRAKSATGRFFRGEKRSERLSGKWANTPSAKGYNDATPSEKKRDERFQFLNSTEGPVVGLPSDDAKKMMRQMSTKVGDVSGVFHEEDEEEESVSASPKRNIGVRDTITCVGISDLLNQELEGGSSYASESGVDGGSSLTSYDQRTGSYDQSASHVLGEKSLVSHAEAPSDSGSADRPHSAHSGYGGEGEDVDLLAPQRVYSSLSNRPAPPAGAEIDPEQGGPAVDGGVYFDEDGNKLPFNSSGEAPMSPTTHDQQPQPQPFEYNVQESGSMYSNSNTVESAAHSHLSATELALDAMYSQQMLDEESSDEDGFERRVTGEEYDDDLPAEELDHEASGSQPSDRSSFDENVPSDRMRDRGSGEMGEDGVFLEETERLLSSSAKSSGRRRSSLFQTMVGSLGFVSAEDFDEDGEEKGSDHGDEVRSTKEKNKLAEHMKRMDYDNSCFRALKRAFFGEVRWSQIAFFPVVKFKLAEEDLDCNRGEITLRVLRSNRGVVVRGLDSGVRNMSLGETSQIKVRYDKAYASFCLGQAIPPRANIVFTAELITINGRGKYGMPLRQLKRMGRFIWKIKDAVVGAAERAYWRAAKKYKGVVDITGPPDSYYLDEEDDFSYASSADSWGSFKPDEDDEEKRSRSLAGEHLGAKIMWGFAPEKRPIKKKRQKTEYEKLLERQAYVSKKRSEKAMSRKRQKLLESHGSALDEHDKLLNMGLGENVDMDFQLGEGCLSESFTSGPGGDSASAGSANLLQNVITDDLAVSDVRSNDGHEDDENKLKLDLDHVLGDEDVEIGGGSKKSKGGKKKKKEKKSAKNDKSYRVR